ncbi:MAG TPA: phospholipase D-like domain-containing protein [Candidatus Thermoplasmatota archaeon]|nr:phospholipase D-like domain-containing protein [Candidatus Thermoplasmatota archaeon]
MRRARVGDLFLVVLVVLAPGLSLPPAGASPGTLAVEAPRWVPGDGTPFGVFVTAPEGAEVRVWIGSAASPASRVWDGAAWVAGARYAARATGDVDLVPLALDPKKIPAGASTLPGGARVRVGDRIVAETAFGVALAPADAARLAPVEAPNGAAVRDAAGALLALAPRPVPDPRDPARVATPVLLLAAETATLPARDPATGAALDLGLASGGLPKPETRVVAGRATLFATPREGTPVLRAVLAEARASLDVAVYTLSSPTLAVDLADAARRGVRTRLLVEGAPAGGFPGDSSGLLAALARAGVAVRLVEGAGAMHAKYVVADERATLVASENWGSSAYPPSPRSERGNRGWGVVVEDAGLAADLARVFALDFARAAPLEPGEPSRLAAPPETHEAWDAAATSAGPRRARLLVAPDASLAPDGLLGVLASAERSLDVQLLRAETRWSDGPNPYVESLVAAARRGVSVRVMLDAGFMDPDNAATAARLNAIAARERLPLEARMANPAGIATIHNKGVVADGRVVVVGSLNWGRASALANREVNLVLEDATLAAHALGRFEEDWRATSPAIEAPRPMPGAGALLVALALGLGLAVPPERHRRDREHERRDEGDGSHVREDAARGFADRGLERSPADVGDEEHPPRADGRERQAPRPPPGRALRVDAPALGENEDGAETARDGRERDRRGRRGRGIDARRG